MLMKSFSDCYLNYDKCFFISRKYPGHLNVTLSCMWFFYFSLISCHSVYQSLRLDSVTLSWRTFWFSHPSGYRICNIEFHIRNPSQFPKDTAFHRLWNSQQAFPEDTPLHPHTLFRLFRYISSFYLSFPKIIFYV